MAEPEAMAIDTPQDGEAKEETTADDPAAAAAGGSAASMEIDDNDIYD